MHRIDGAGHVNNMFVSEDPATNRPPTEVTPDILNALQEEVAGVIEYFGGALDKNNNGQLLQYLLVGLRASGLFQTPPQFDASTKAATMEALHRALGSRSGIKEVSTATALGAEDAGKLVIFTAGSSPATLPELSSVVPGTEFEFFGAVAATNSVSRAGIDVIYVNNTTVTSFSIGQGSSARVVARATGWALVGGTANLVNAQLEFGASLGASGYQKLPSGLIVQWGFLYLTWNGSTSRVADVTFPIAFPNNCYGTYCSSGTATSDLDAGYRGNWEVLQVAIPTTVGCEINMQIKDARADDRIVRYVSIGR